MTVDRLAVAQLAAVRWVEVLVCTCSQPQVEVRWVEVRLHFQMLLQEQMPLEVVEVLDRLAVQLVVVSAEDS